MVCGNLREDEHGWWIEVPAYRVDGEIETEIGPYCCGSKTAKGRSKSKKMAKAAWMSFKFSVSQWGKKWREDLANKWYYKKVMAGRTYKVEQQGDES